MKRRQFLRLTGSASAALAALPVVSLLPSPSPPLAMTETQVPITLTDQCNTAIAFHPDAFQFMWGRDMDLRRDVIYGSQA